MIYCERRVNSCLFKLATIIFLRNRAWVHWLICASTWVGRERFRAILTCAASLRLLLWYLRWRRLLLLMFTTRRSNSIQRWFSSQSTNHILQYSGINRHKLLVDCPTVFCSSAYPCENNKLDFFRWHSKNRDRCTPLLCDALPLS